MLITQSLCKISGLQKGNVNIVYVSLSGQDTDTCGEFSDPCRTIDQAVHRIDWDGYIYLNGSGTKLQPFTCKGDRENATAHDQDPGISIDKSVSMEGFESTPYVACEKGFHFYKYQRRMRVKLSGIAFNGTPLTFDDCDQVQLINCSHKNTMKPVTVTTTTIPVFRFDIQGALFFQNSYHCVKITVGEGSCHSLFMEIKRVRFQENGVLDIERHVSLKALISIATHKQTYSRLRRVHISFSDVTCTRNTMPFLILDVLTAMTKELYTNVKILNNSFSNSHNKDKRHFTDGMYISRAGKPDVSFVNFICANNSNNLALRCIKISSNSTKVNIKNSLFIELKVRSGKGGAVSVVCKRHSSLVVTNTTFANTSANFGGGAIFLDASVKGNLRLNLTNVNFTNCDAQTQGSAVMVGKSHQLKAKPIQYTLYAHIKNIQIKNCYSLDSAICLMLGSGHVTFEQFHWTGFKHETAGAIYVGGPLGKTEVTIKESSFTNGGIFARITALKKHKGCVRIVNTSMFNSQDSALVISPKYKISLLNITISSSKHALDISESARGRSLLNPVQVAIDNCTFRDNVYDVTLTLRDPRSVSFTIVNSIFKGTTSKIQRHGHAVRFVVPPLKKLNGSTAKITLDKVIFDSRPASSFALFFPGKKIIIVRRSIFHRCASFRREEWDCGNSKSFYVTSSGAISIMSIIDKPWKLGCCQRNTQDNTHPQWKYDSHVTFEDTIFQENAGLYAGAVFVSNGFTTFQNCSFENNLAARKTGQVYSSYGTGRVEFYNCSFSSFQRMNATLGLYFGHVAFFYSESEGSVVFSNTSMISAVEQRSSYSVLEITNGAYVDIDENTIIQCRRNQLSLQNATHFIYTEKRKKRYCLVNVTVLRFSCRLCSPGYYSLQTGHSRGLTVNDSFRCQPCPLGATCIRNDINIAAEEDFWGYKIPDQRPMKLKFVPCPKKYCRTPNPRSELSAYNSCFGNRTGFLCGQCAPGFSESLFTAECKRATKCSHYLWIVIFSYSFALALYLITKPPLLYFVNEKQILWFIKKNRNLPTDNTRQENEKLDSGYLKIAFYYYQVADLLLGNSLEEVIPKFRFTAALLSAFNFKVQAIYRGIDCTLPGLTAVTKQLLLSVAVFGTMANVCLIYCIHLVLNLVRKRARRPPVSHYMAVVLEILLLGYDRLAETSLVLMQCVSIGSKQRLFIDGNTPCWQTWQYLLLGYIIVFLVPFIAVLYCGSLKLHKSSISARAFLAACVIPLPFLVYWLLKWVFKRGNGREERGERRAATSCSDKEVMKVLQEPFRAPIGENGGALYWESVLIGRRLILLTFHSFIQNAMLRFLLMAGVCDFMAIHHIVKKPFRDPKANKIEAISLITLAIVAKISLIKATLLSSGIDAKAQNQLYIEGMEWFEFVAMSLVPFLICLLAVLAFLSQIVRLIFLIAKKGIVYMRCRDSQRSREDLQEPLLNNQGDQS